MPCQLTLEYLSGTSVFDIPDIGIGVMAGQPNDISYLFGCGSLLVDSVDLQQAITNGNLELVYNGSTVSNLQDLCSSQTTSSPSSGSVSLWTTQFGIKGTVEPSEILLKGPSDIPYYVVDKTCQLIQISAISQEWNLTIERSTDQGQTWTSLTNLNVSGGFTTANLVDVNLSVGDYLRARYVKTTQSVENPLVLLTFSYSGPSIWTTQFGIKGTVEPSEILLKGPSDIPYYVVDKTCQLIQISAISQEWNLTIERSTDQGQTWTSLTNLNVSGGFTTANLVDVNLSVGDYLRARYVKTTQSVENPLVLLTFSYSGLSGSVNEERHYFGASPYPYTPVEGNHWTEIDGSNVYVNDWVYSLGKWVTIWEKQVALNVFTINPGTAGSSGSITRYINPLSFDKSVRLTKIMLTLWIPVVTPIDGQTNIQAQSGSLSLGQYLLTSSVGSIAPVPNALTVLFGSNVDTTFSQFRQFAISWNRVGNTSYSLNCIFSIVYKEIR